MADAILSIVKPCIRCGASNRYPSGKCKPCGDVASGKYRLANPDKTRRVQMAWYEQNKSHATAMRLAYRAANLEKETKFAIEYREKNKERLKLNQAQYRERNKSQFKVRDAQKYQIQTEKCKAYNKTWYANNPDAVSIKNQNRRARLRNVGGQLSKALPLKLFTLQRGKCACCGLVLGDNYHLDHIMPLALGGTNTDDNIQLLRAKCNNQKHASHPVDFMQERGFLL